MKVSLVVFILLSVCISAAAQNSLRVKVYHNTDNVEQTAISDPFTYKSDVVNRVWNFKRFSFAVEFGKQKLKHQFELFFPQIQRPTHVPSYPLNYDYLNYRPCESTAFAFRYEVLKRFGGKSDPINFSFGLGLNPYYQRTSYPEMDGASYRQSERFGAVINAIPAIEIKLSERLSLELSAPVKVYDLRYFRLRIKSPTLPVDLQTNGGFEHIFFETAYTIRTGLIYALR